MQTVAIMGWPQEEGGRQLASEPVVRSISNQTVSTVDLVTAEIRRAILVGSLPPGEQFSIRELARQLGVSHIPIREALRRLESQGLIVLKQAQSASVTMLTMEDIDSIYNLRLSLEPGLAAKAVPLHAEENLERLRELLELTRSREPDISWQAHRDFHAELVRPATTEWDLRVLGLLWTAAERYTRLIFDPTSIDDRERQRRYDLHDALLQSAVARDPELMMSRLTEHLTLNEDVMRGALDTLRKAMKGHQ